MTLYTTKIKKLSGTNYSEVLPQAKVIYKNIEAKTKRRPYVRSAYFKGEKIFLDFFWNHLFEKNLSDRTRRLKYYACALDLMINSHIEPVSRINPNKSSETLFRFSGITQNKELFVVQIKKDNKTGQKSFMSIFPVEK